jgi:ABC-type transport system involved in multi-copper enzyme maturation permease subunit
VVHGVLEVARHELATAVRTARAIWVAAIYLGSAVLGGIALVFVVWRIEQEVVAQGANPETLSVIGEPAVQKLLAWFTGVPAAELAEVFQSSVIVPAFFWGSLFFLPLLILLTSFDQVASDLQLRSICYSALRVSRPAILLGKLLAQTVVFVGLTVVASLVWFGLSVALLDSFSWGDAVGGFVRVTLLLVPFGLTYLSISAFFSTLVRQPIAALFGALGIVVILWVFGWFGAIPSDHPTAWLRTLQHLSPSNYEAGLWMAGWAGPLTSVAAYSGFALMFLAAATWVLGRRDL